MSSLQVPIEAALSCTACGKGFALFARGHHCENCGREFCGKCTSGRIALTTEENAPQVPVCDECMLFERENLEFCKLFTVSLSEFEVALEQFKTQRTDFEEQEIIFLNHEKNFLKWQRNYFSNEQNFISATSTLRGKPKVHGKWKPSSLDLWIATKKLLETREMLYEAQKRSYSEYERGFLMYKRKFEEHRKTH